MTTPSTRRRRAGALLIGASMLLVPLTASITYAQDEAPEAPQPPLPPAPPLAPEAPAAPLALEAPLPPETSKGTYVIDRIAPDGTRGEHRVIVIRDKDGKHGTHVRQVLRDRHVIGTDDLGHFDEEAFEKKMEALDEQLERLNEEHGRIAMIDHEAIASATRDAVLARRLAPLAIARVPRVVMNCDRHDDVSETTSIDGKRVIRICRQRISAHASAGLRAARAQVAGDASMPGDARKDVLKTLDREIARMEEQD